MRPGRSRSRSGRDDGAPLRQRSLGDQGGVAGQPHSTASGRWSCAHEFGHSLGLDHNFMASVDKPNFPHYLDGPARITSASMRRRSWSTTRASPTSIGSRRMGAVRPGGHRLALHQHGQRRLDAGHQHLGAVFTRHLAVARSQGFQRRRQRDPVPVCQAQHLQYTPFCRQFDLGTTPSEIIANQLDAYEWHTSGATSAVPEQVLG